MSKFEFKPKLFLDLRGYNKEKLTADIMAGLIVGIVALREDRVVFCGEEFVL